MDKKSNNTRSQNRERKVVPSDNDKNPSRSSDPHNPNDPDFQKNQPYAGNNIPPETT